MPLFLIRRDVPEAQREDIDAAAFRAMNCALEFDGLRWVRSHWDRAAGTIICLYEAADREAVIEHARRARIPCDDVSEVEIVAPEEYIDLLGKPPA
jgi:hypothetical protein